MQGIFQKENTDKALKYGIYRHLPTYEKIIRNLVSFCNKIYTILKLLLSTDEDDFKIANAVLRFSEMCASDWNEPELDDSIYNKELLDLL